MADTAVTYIVRHDYHHRVQCETFQDALNNISDLVEKILSTSPDMYGFSMFGLSDSIQRISLRCTKSPNLQYSTSYEFNLFDLSLFNDVTLNGNTALWISQQGMLRYSRDQYWINDILTKLIYQNSVLCKELIQSLLRCYNSSLNYIVYAIINNQHNEDNDYMIANHCVDINQHSINRQYVYDAYGIVRRLYAKYAQQNVNQDHWIYDREFIKILKSVFHNPDEYQLLTNAYKRTIPQDNAIVGYKAFSKRPNFTSSTTLLQCRDYTFNVEEIHVENYVFPCESGFHFCTNIEDIEQYYNLQSSQVVVYKVQGWGVVIEDYKKLVCSHLQILEQQDLSEYFQNKLSKKL